MWIQFRLQCYHYVEMYMFLVVSLCTDAIVMCIFVINSEPNQRFLSFLLCLFIEINAMVISVHLQALIYINTLLRTVMCYEMYKSINCIPYIYHNIFIHRLVFNDIITKSLQLIENDFG